MSEFKMDKLINVLFASAKGFQEFSILHLCIIVSLGFFEQIFVAMAILLLDQILSRVPAE